MEYRRLGHTDIDVSAICLGTMTWGQQNTEAEGHEQMEYAVEMGINFFDTAEMYAVPPMAETQGKTEEIIGTWFQKKNNRQDIILATKVAGRAPMDWLRDDGSGTEQSRSPGVRVERKDRGRPEARASEPRGRGHDSR
mgnify:CR=1 FL=1